MRKLVLSLWIWRWSSFIDQITLSRFIYFWLFKPLENKRWEVGVVIFFLAGCVGLWYCTHCQGRCGTYRGPEVATRWASPFRKYGICASMHKITFLPLQFLKVFVCSNWQRYIFRIFILSQDKTSKSDFPIFLVHNWKWFNEVLSLN